MTIAAIASLPLSASAQLWVHRPLTPNPAMSTHGAMAYDSVRFRTVHLQKTTFGMLAWEYDGNKWARRHQRLAPPPSHSHALVYDTKRRRIVMVGTSQSSTSADTWVWNGVSWIKLILLVNAPQVVAGYAMVYDSARDRLVLFGGEDTNKNLLGDTWELDGPTWVRVAASATTPPARMGHAMVYDSNLGVTVMFGGYDGSKLLNDTWSWDGKSWVQLNLPASPPVRSGHAMAYDTVSGHVVLFGGGQKSTHFGDTWKFDGQAWVQHASNHSPTPRSTHAMSYDSQRQCVVLYGGDSSSDSTWEFTANPSGYYTVTCPPGSLNMPTRDGPNASTLPRVGQQFAVHWPSNYCSSMLLLVGSWGPGAHLQITIPGIDGWLLTSAEHRERIAYNQTGKSWMIPSVSGLVGGRFFIQYVGDNCLGLQSFSSVGEGLIGR